MSLRDELQRIYEDSGRLTPSIVVAHARDPQHPLHSRFTWDDSVAGERWRREEARLMITSVRVTYRPATSRRPAGSVRAFPGVPSDEGGEFDYVPAGEIAADPVATSVVLAAMEREWKVLKARYGHFAEFAAMVQGDDLAA